MRFDNVSPAYIDGFMDDMHARFYDNRQSLALIDKTVGVLEKIRKSFSNVPMILTHEVSHLENILHLFFELSDNPIKKLSIFIREDEVCCEQLIISQGHSLEDSFIWLTKKEK